MPAFDIFSYYETGKENSIQQLSTELNRILKGHTSYYYRYARIP